MTRTCVRCSMSIGAGTRTCPRCVKWVREHFGEQRTALMRNGHRERGMLLAFEDLTWTEDGSLAVGKLIGRATLEVGVSEDRALERWMRSPNLDPVYYLWWGRLSNEVRGRIATIAELALATLDYRERDERERAG